MPPAVEQRPEYLVGFIEGRLNAACPRWWKIAISSARADMRGKLEFTVESVIGDEHVGGVELPKDATAAVNSDGDLTITVGRRQVGLTKRTFELGRSNADARALAVALSDDASFVAWTGAHSVYVMRVNDRQEAWSAPIRGEWNIGSFGGPGKEQRTSIEIIDDRVAVFTASSRVAYMEVFDADKGRCLFRFSTGACEWSR